MSDWRWRMELLGDRLGAPMPKTLPEGKRLFTVKEAAPYFDMHEETLRKKIRSGEIRAEQASARKTYIRRAEIMRWWDERL